MAKFKTILEFADPLMIVNLNVMEDQEQLVQALVFVNVTIRQVQ